MAVAQQARERARSRWLGAAPDHRLTWAKELNGDGFIQAVSRHHGFEGDGRILEIGPGYGRLLASLLGLRIPFDHYAAVELSAKNAEHLRGRFGHDPRVEVIQGDVEELDLPDKFDLAISSLTFKHLYPSCEKAVRAVRAHLDRHGQLCFDLLEGSLLYRLVRRERYFKSEPGGTWTYIRRYRRREVQGMLFRQGFTDVTFDTVEHDPAHRRLLVVARAA